MADLSKIARALATLDDRTRVTRGAAADAMWIAAQEEAAGTVFCPAYVAFLKEFGALRLETDGLGDWHADLVFPGHAPEARALQLGPALEWLRDTFEEWGTEPAPGAPVMMYGDGSGWPDALVTADGKLSSFHRNQLFAQGGDFDDAVLTRIDAIREGLAAGAETVVVRTTLLEGAVSQAPAAWNARFTAGCATFVRPRDGTEITARLGDGRELHGSDGEQGVFVSWYEPGARDLETLNAWNADAAFVRASCEERRTRYRGLLPVTGLDARLLLELVAHDAGLALASSQRPVPSMDALQTALVLPPGEHTFFARRWTATAVRVDGDALVVPIDVPGGLSFDQGLGPSPDVRVRIRADGLVEAVHRSPTRPPRAEALAGLERVNGNALGENNADLEPCVRGVLQSGDVAALSVVTPFGAVASPAFITQIAALGRAIRAATFLAKPDPMDAIVREHEARTGRPFGPHGRALLEYTLDRSLALLGKGRERRFRSPWGTLVEIAERRGDSATSFARQLDHFTVSVALAVDHGASSDDCPVVGIDVSDARASTWPARVLARNLADFVSVLLLHTTGFDFDGDDDFAWRAYRTTLRDSRWSSPRPETELAQRLDVQPAHDVGAVQAAGAAKIAPLPAHGEVTR